MTNLLSNTLTLLAQTTPPPEQPSMFDPTTLLFFGVIFFLFYFIILRPQKKEQKAREEAVESLKKGTAVVTIGGIHGVVQEVDKEKGTVIISVDRNTRLTMNRTAIVVQPPPKETAPAADTKETATAKK